MAMGISHNYNKGGNSNSNNNRGKPCGLMMVLVFGAALLGILVVHKLRERRIFNLLIKERDTQLVALRLALQKEKDYSVEVRRKHEELKAKMYSIRTEKMASDRTIAEMKSTIGSLEEELKAMKTALEEKQNETKIARVNADDQNENPRMMGLLESLRRKEAEIEDLKHRLEYKVWSVSTDDPSNSSGNLRSVPGSRPGNGNTTEVKDQIGNGEGETHQTKLMAKKSEKLELDNFQEVTTKRGGSGDGNATEEGHGKKDQGFKDIDREGIDEENRMIRGNDHFAKYEDSDLGSGQKLHANSERGMKLEMQDHKRSQNNDRSRVRGKRDYDLRNQEKKWRLVAKKGSYRNNGVTSLRVGRFFKDDQGEFAGREEEASLNKKPEDGGRSIKGTEAAYSSDAINLEPQTLKHVDTSDGNGKFSGIEANDTKQKLGVGISFQQDSSNREISKYADQQDLPGDMENADEEEHENNQDFPGDLEIADAEEQENDVTEDGYW